MLDNEQKLWYNLNKKLMLQGASWFASQCLQNAGKIPRIFPVCPDHSWGSTMIYRTPKDSSHLFTQISNTIIEDNTLSYRAKGILLYLLSKPKNWKFNEVDIVKHSSDGKKSISTGIKELITKGYVKRAKSKDKSGKWSGYLYEIYELARLTENLFSENGKTENGKRTISNTEHSNTEFSNTNKYINGHFENHKVPIEYINGADFPKSGKIPTRYISQSDFQSHPIIAEYMRLYQQRFSRSHPSLSGEHRQQVIDGIDDKDLGFCDYTAVIEQYFDTHFRGGCDYNILHFAAGDIIQMRMYETSQC